MTGVLKARTGPGVWIPIGVAGMSQDDVQAYVDAQVAAAIAAATAPVRFRLTRAAYNILNGDQAHLGTGTFIESSGGFSGAGTPATPLVVPSAGSYALTAFYGGAVFGGTVLSAPIFEAAGTTIMAPAMIQNTTTRMGGTVVVYCEALSTVVFKIRNNTGATVNGVTMLAEAVKVAN
jgi:hypothetical protein